jgi:hypothetical protein
MSVAELVVTKGGLKYILIGTAGKELFLFSLPSFELMGQLKLQQSVHAVNFIANGFALVAVQDRLISIGINKNSIENLGESDQRFPEIWSIRKMENRPEEYVLGSKDGLRFITFRHTSNSYKPVLDIETQQPLILLSGRQTLQVKEIAPDLLLTADYNMPGYFLVNRASREIRHI